MATVDRHHQSRFWRVRFTDATGKRVTRTLKTTDKSIAMKMASDLELAARRAREGSFSTDRGRDLVNQLLVASGNSALDQYSTKEFFERWLAGKKKTKAANTGIRYATTVETFLDHLGPLSKKPLSSILTRHIEDFRDKLHAKGRATATLRMDMKTVNGVFAQAVKQGLISTNPAAAVELDDAAGAEKSPFTPQDLSQLLAFASPDWKTAILLGAYAGLRLSDAAKLTWNAVDFENGILNFKPQKTARKGRTLSIPMHPVLAAHLESIAGEVGGPICPSLAGKGTGGKSGLSSRFLRIMQEAGIDNRASKVNASQARAVSAKSFHSLRHFFNSALLNAGVDEKTRMDLSGHTTTSINRKYSHAETETLRKAVSKI